MAILNQGEAENILMQHLEDNIPSGVDVANVSYPNAPGNTPKNKEWLSADINWATSDNVEAGSSPLIRTFGILIIDVNVPVGSDNDIVVPIQQSLISTFRNKSISGVSCEETLIDVLGKVKQWYTRRLSIFFYIEGF